MEDVYHVLEWFGRQLDGDQLSVYLTADVAAGVRFFLQASNHGLHEEWEVRGFAGSHKIMVDHYRFVLPLGTGVTEVIPYGLYRGNSPACQDPCGGYAPPSVANGSHQ